jgi:hypothetical protein
MLAPRPARPESSARRRADTSKIRYLAAGPGDGLGAGLELGVMGGLGDSAPVVGGAGSVAGAAVGPQSQAPKPVPSARHA